MRPNSQNCLLGTFFICLLMYVAFLYTSSANVPEIYFYFNDHNSITCHKAKNMSRLPDISEVVLRKGKSIFFHETSCRSYTEGKITLAPRQACAVESAARANPHLDVYLTFSSPGVFNFEGTESDRVLQKLLAYKNIHIKSLNMEAYMKGTPLEDLFHSGKMEKSQFVQFHSSDVLRFLTLFKYGGVYLDLDVIVLKSFQPLGTNFAGIEDGNQIGSAVIALNYEGPGHELAGKCVTDLKENFSTDTFVGNGPGVITRALQHACNVTDTFAMPASTKCQFFKVLQPSAFYPVYWQWWDMYFYPETVQQVEDMAKDSYTLHLWNKMSEGVRVPVHVVTAYTKYAAKSCPEVFSACDLLF